MQPDSPQASGRHRLRLDHLGQQRPAVALVEWYWSRRRSMDTSAGRPTAPLSGAPAVTAR